MSFINARMPERITAGFRIGPDWNTTVIRMDNGREQRNRNWRYPRYRGQANLGVFNATDRQDLMGLFMAAGGMHKAFRVRDPTDFRVANEPLAVLAGTDDPVQMAREYAFGPESTQVLIQAPVQGTTTIYKDGVAYTECTVDYETGIVTPGTTWPAGTYTFTTQYDRWMRFDNDWGSFVANTVGVWTTDIELVEVRR